MPSSNKICFTTVVLPLPEGPDTVICLPPVLSADLTKGYSFIGTNVFIGNLDSSNISSRLYFFIWPFKVCRQF